MPLDEKTARRVDRAMLLIAEIRLKLLRRKQRGESYWFGQAAEFQNIDEKDMPSRN